MEGEMEDGREQGSQLGLGLGLGLGKCIARLGKSTFIKPPPLLNKASSTAFVALSTAHIRPYLCSTMRITINALLALPIALRVACLHRPIHANSQAGVDQILLDEVCPDYANYARVKQ